MLGNGATLFLVNIYKYSEIIKGKPASKFAKNFYTIYLMICKISIFTVIDTRCYVDCCYQGNQAVVIGVVPWLGTFITDLVMIDSSCDNHTPEGYINFNKCRKVHM